MAKAIAQELGLDVDSAGVGATDGGPADPRAVALFPQLRAHRTQQLTPELVAEHDVVVAMAEAAPLIDRDDLMVWDVPDPVAGDLETYERTRDDLRRRIEVLLQQSEIR